MPIHPPADALLTRAQIAEALNNEGFPIKPATLATMATRLGGPPYRIFGRTPLYRWGTTLAWAHARLAPPRSRSAAADQSDDKAEPQAA